MKAITPYIEIARIDHWFKNVFLIPGIVVALYAQPDLLSWSSVIPIIFAFFFTGIIASSNYTLNELLDAKFDALHPVKKKRPVPSGRANKRIALIQWLALAVFGLMGSWLLGYRFFLVALALWIMGCIYNIPPIRSKDRAYIDVLSESVNNPLRLLLGWYATGITVLPPVSLVFAYWMIGAFFMAIKRLGEFRFIDDTSLLSEYRRSFRFYTEERLLISIVYYSVAFGLSFGIFLMRYKMELLLSIPAIAGFMAWYIHLGFLDNSPTQNPEKLYTQKSFVVYCFFCISLVLSLLYIDIPALHDLFESTIN